MGALSVGARRFTLGERVLDETLFELRRAGERVAVQPKVLSLLFYLIEHRARVVTTEELLRELWPDATVSKASVKRAIRGARLALGDDGDSQSSIRTVVGRGYQFVSEIEGGAGPAKPALRARHEEPFVGRQHALALLEARLALAIGARAQCVLLRGEAGIGKTRLVHELASRARALGMEVLTGRCLEVEGAPAYWPWLQMLTELASSRGAAGLRARMAEGAAELAGALPELRALIGEVPSAPQIDAAHARFRLFDSMGRLLARCAAERPLLLVLEDVQRADQPTLRLLVSLVRQLAHERIATIATVRDTSVRDAQVPQLLEELSRCDGTTTLSLEGIQPDEVARYIELTLGEPAPAPFAAELHARTAGNPLFIRQLVLSLQAAAAPLDARSLQGLARDRSLHDAIARHTEGLSEACRELLQLAAAIGRECSLALLAQACDQRIASVLDRIDEAVAAGVMCPSDGARGHYRFVHALVRDVLYESLSPSQRARLHGRIAEVLEASWGDGDADKLAELAHHYGAALSLFPERALAYAIRAARAAAERLAYEEAASMFERALGFLAMQPPDDALRLELRLEQGEALVQAEQHDAAQRTLGEAIQLARARGDIEALVRAVRALCSAPEDGTVSAARVRVLEDTLALLPSAHPAQPLLRALLAKALIFAGELERRFELAREAVARARLARDVQARGHVLRLAHLSLSEPQQQAERRAISDELTALAHGAADRQLLLHASMTRAQDCLERGDLAGTDAAIATMDTLASGTRQPFFRFSVAVLRATRATLDARLDEALIQAEAAFALGRRYDEPSAWHYHCVQRHALYRLHGQLAEAEAMVREASARFPALIGWRAVLACLAGQQGRRELARDELKRLLDTDLAQARRDPWVLSALCPLADLCMVAGDTRSAELLYTALLPHAELNGIVAFATYSHGPVVRHLGALAARMHRFELAQPHFEAALAQTPDMPAFEALTRIAYADMLCRRKQPEDRARAAGLLAQAVVTSRRHGLRGLEGHCEQLASYFALEASAPAVAAREG